MGKISESDHHHPPPPPPNWEYLFPYNFGVWPYFADRPPSVEQLDLGNITPYNPSHVYTPGIALSLKKHCPQGRKTLRISSRIFATIPILIPPLDG